MKYRDINFQLTTLYRLEKIINYSSVGKKKKQQKKTNRRPASWTGGQRYIRMDVSVIFHKTKSQVKLHAVLSARL